MTRDYTFTKAVYAFSGCVLGWAVALASFQTWLHCDPERVSCRVGALIFGVISSAHVWSVASRHISDLPSAVGFPIKFAVALTLTAVGTGMLTWIFSLSLSVLVFNSGAGLPPWGQFLMGLLFGVFSLAGSEAAVFDSDLSRPSRPISLIGRVLRFLWSIFPTASGLGQKLGRAIRNWRRGVRPRHDENPVQSAEEARRRAERIL